MKKINNEFFTPTKKIVAPNDKFAKCLFTFSQAEWSRRINEQIPFDDGSNKGGYGFIEGDKKIKKDVRSKYNLLIDNASMELSFDEYENLFLPLNMFDRAVMTAIISEWTAGNVEITVPSIWRLITGKPSGSGLMPSKRHAAEILASVKKLACVHLKADITDACKKFNYNDGKPLYFDYTPLIDCTISDFVSYRKCKQVITQVITQVISINTEPILYTIATAKKQLVTFSRDWLNTGKSHNSDAVIAAKIYTAVRVLEINGSRKLTDTISFDTIFDKCGLSDASNKVLMSVRKVIIGVLNNLQSEGVLKSFEIVREGTGKKFTKIQLTYMRHSKS